MIKPPLTKILFLDIETVGLEKDYEECLRKHPKVAAQFVKYFDWFLKRFPEDKETETFGSVQHMNEVFSKRAALVPEFAKIICISFAYISPEGEIKSKSYSGDDEFTLLKDSQSSLDMFGKKEYYLCGHNLKNFDIPMMAKRMVINGLLPPSILPSYDTKPWEMKVIDTKDVWLFGAYSAIGSLDLMCTCLDVPSSKEGEVTGDKVRTSYWDKQMLKEITEYCERDVYVLIDVVQRLKNLK
jgi:hypothetical protein